MRKLQPNPPRKSLETIHESFIRPNLDYCGVAYDGTFNQLNHQSLESFQYRAVTTITGVLRGAPAEKLFQELDLEKLKSRR